MPYVDEDGKMNNFAREPKMYVSEAMDPMQKRNTTVFAAIGALVVVGLMALAAIVS
jgi:hypothetical protein